MVGGKQEKKPNGKKAFKSFNKKDAKPKSLEDLKKKITGKGFKPKGDKKHAGKDKKGGFQKKKPASDAVPLSKNAAKAASQPNYSHKPYSKLVEQMKTHWNKLREHSTPQEVKNNIVKEMIKAMSQHVMDITLRHDAARIVQAIIQFGNVTQQDAIIAEIQPKMGDVAKTPYGHFVILKAMNYCNQKPQMKKIAQALQGSFVSLGTHVIGARVVETILQLYPSQISRSLKSEFYGKKFTILMPETPRNLRELITALPNKSAAILDHMRDLALKFIQKGLISFVYTHHLLWEYVQELALSAATTAAATTEDGSAVVNNKGNNRINELVNALAEAGPKLLSTKPGAKVMTFVITYSTAKDRKRIIKSLKGHVLESLVHESAYLGTLRLLDVVDDTVNVHKSFFDELKATERVVQYAANGDIVGHKDPAWLQICLHHNAHKLILRLLTPHQRHLETDESAVLDVTSPYSKKDDNLRRKEHIVYIKPVLLKVCAMYTSDLVRSRFGSKVLQAIYETFAPEQLVESLANVYADQFVEVVVDDGKRVGVTKSNQSEDSDDEEEDEEEEDDDSEEDEEDVLPDEFDGDEEDDNEEEEGEDEVAEEVENDAEYQTLLAEAAKDNQQQKPSNANNTAQPSKKELLPIEEDACAHVLLKKLLQFETALILSKHADDKNNKVLRALHQYQADDQAQHNSHNNTASNNNSQSFSSQLEVQVSGFLLTPPGLAQRLVALFETHNDVFQRYVKCNRGCFALHVLFQVPGLFQDMQSLVARLQGSAFTAETVSPQEGGKLLLKLQAASNALHSSTVENTTKAAPKTAEKKNAKKAATAVAVEEPAVVEEEPVAPTSAAKKGRGRPRANSNQSDTVVAVGKRSRSNTEDEDNNNNTHHESISDTESVASSTTSATRRSSRRLAAASTTTAETAETVVAPTTAQKNKRARLAAVAEEEKEEEEEDIASPVKTRGRKSIAPTVAAEAPKSAKKTPAKRGAKAAAAMEEDEEEVEDDAPKRGTRGRKSTSAK